MESYSLYELNEYLRRVIALNFAEPIWVHAEISQCKQSRGQYYLNLIEKQEDGEEIIAYSDAVIWYKTFLFIKKKLGSIVDSLLSEGTEVRVKVRIDYNERYGLKLVIEDIDPKYTLGQVELNRQKIIERLNKEGLVDLNEKHHLSSVLQDIAVISSETAAGYQDFIKQLQDNSYDYDYELHLYSAAMQGYKTKAEVSRAIQAACEAGHHDCIVVIRGGGSKLDLSSFDDYDIGKAISDANIPVLTGIGHQIDNTVADLVSHTSLKTPTAVADFLLEHNANYEASLIYIENQISTEINNQLINETYLVSNLEQRLITDSKMKIFKLDTINNGLTADLTQASKLLIERNKLNLQSAHSQIDILDPINILKRGFAAVKQSGKYVQNISKLNMKKELEIEMMDGKLKAIPK